MKKGLGRNIFKIRRINIIATQAISKSIFGGSYSMYVKFTPHYPVLIPC